MALAEAESFRLRRAGLTLPFRAPGKERELPALQPLVGTQGPQPPLPQTPAGPSQPTRHEAKGSTDQELGGVVPNSSLQQGPGTHQDHQK